MSGRFFLDHASLPHALALINDVALTLSCHGVTYSLDGGTALGIIREGRLLPWDTDIDLAVDAKDWRKLKNAGISLFLKGYRVRFRRAKSDAGPISRGDIRVMKIWRRRFFFFKGEMVDVFLRYIEDENCYWLLEGKDRKALCKMPVRFHNQLTSVYFNGINHNIPLNWDEFLTHRYGDWRTPVINWDAFVDDGSIDKQNAKIKNQD